MKITVIKKNRLNNFTLPEKISGNFWITDDENGKKINLINIEAQDNNWTIISNQDAYLVDNNDILIASTILKENSFYCIKNNYKNQKYYLYASRMVDESYKEFSIENNQKINVGKEKSCEICYQLESMQKVEFTIENKDNHYYLTPNSTNSAVYLNQKRVLSQKRFEYGDIIFLYGLKMILMNRSGKDYFLVNNPNNLVNYSVTFSNLNLIKSNFVDDKSELPDDSAYNDEFFYRTPHFYNELEPLSLEIESPPAKRGEDKTPVALTIGPMITMSISSIILLMSSLSASANGNKGSTTQLITSAAMLASTLLWPFLTRRYQKLSSRMYERKRVGLYTKYIQNKEAEINRNLERQKNVLLDNNFSVTDSQNIILGHNVKLWQKRITDEDFLTLPIGIGDVPMKLSIKYPEEHFSLEDDKLLELARNLGKQKYILNSVPITYSFYNNIGTGIVGEQYVTKEFIDRVILQMMSNYSYDELKIVTLTSVDNESDWDYIKILPHSWSNDKSMRYFGSTNDDYREIMYALEKIYNERKAKSNDDKKPMPHYVIITDAVKSIDSYDFLKEIMTSKVNVGFSIIMLVNKISALPNECKTFINVTREECGILSSIVNDESQRFKIDFSPIDDIYNCAKELANIPMDIKTEVEAVLPDSFQFLEMFQVGKVEQLNVLERWKKSNPILSLQTPVGIGKNKELILLDLHEKYHGPHGLIAGTTGSGKSEFIITYVLSLAVNYHPYEVQIILIDYKGGGLTGAFFNDKYHLPHIAGTITNLDGNELNRSLASIESEIKRRQAIFNEAKKIANESTLDIYKYQRLWREKRLGDLQPVAHLFIISDEFAELKEQRPEFMEKLISVARVGRSLGVHLILATQKPAGVVNSQIWSNTRFRVCLKVQEPSDSKEVIQKPDAAYLKKTGRFYLQVGYDEIYTLGQAAWSGGQYYPNPTFRKEQDTGVNIINNVGFVTTTKESAVVNTTKSLGEELPNVVKYICNVAESENIKINKLWLDKIPALIYVDNLREKYNFKKEPYNINPIIGEYDDPDSQNQYLLTVPFTKFGNVLLCGIAGSGKEKFLQSLIYSTITSYAPQEVNFYIIDFGADTLKAFATSPHVGDIITINDNEKFINLFKMINFELEKRKELFAEFGGTYTGFIRDSKKSIPNIIVVINNYEAFIENYESFTEVIAKMSREAYKYGIYFIITANNYNSVRLKVKQNFAINYSLQQNNSSDYSNMFGNVRGKEPAKYKGRGLFKNEKVFEFQTASITDESQINKYIKAICEQHCKKTNYRAPKVPVLPEVVNYQEIKNFITDTSNMVVGINKIDLAIEKYDFKKSMINCVTSNDLESIIPFATALIEETALNRLYSIVLVNYSDYEFNTPNAKRRTVNHNEIEKMINDMSNYVTNISIEYEKNKSIDYLETQQKFMLFIVGIDEFLTKLSEESKAKFAELLELNKKLSLITITIMDNAEAISKYIYQEWFSSNADLSRGIWIGNGIAYQSLFKMKSMERTPREEIDSTFGYVIQNGKSPLTKLLTDFTPKDE